MLDHLRRRIHAWLRPRRDFSSQRYWRDRYASGGNSGAGSYERFAEYKAAVLNEFVARENVASVIEFGCGDGNQLRYADYPAYLGIDVSEDALRQCRERFASDPTKRFVRLDDYHGERADLALSLDVIYHLVEDTVFEAYMASLFDAAERFVCIYSSDDDAQIGAAAAHVRHRRYSDWVAKHRPDWQAGPLLANPYAFDGDAQRTTFAQFRFYRRSDA